MLLFQAHLNIVGTAVPCCKVHGVSRMPKLQLSTWCSVEKLKVMFPSEGVYRFLAADPHYWSGARFVEVSPLKSANLRELAL